MHLFLTGSKKVGKSTLLRNALAPYTSWYSGFYTQIHQVTDTHRKLYLTDTTGQRSALAATLTPSIQVFPQAFSSLGIQLVQESETHGLLFTVMDELGRLEDGVSSFHQAVLHRLAQPKPVIGVLQQCHGALPAAVAALENVRLVVVTPQNREACAKEVEFFLQQTLSHP